MAFPTSSDIHGVSIAFDDDAGELAPTWTRIDTGVTGVSVQSWSVNRGRQSELDKTGTGTATVTIADTTGTFDPTNSSSVLNGKISTVIPAAIALYNPVTTDWSTVFRGFVSEWLFTMDQSADILYVTLELVDAFGYFSGLEMIPGVHGDTAPSGSENDVVFLGEPDTAKHVDGRLRDITDAALWNEDLTDFFSGNVTVRGPKVYERKDSILSALQDTADAEFPGVSNIYVSKDGIVRFRGRFARFNPSNPDYGINTWSVGSHPEAVSDPDVVPISNLEFRLSENDIVNASYATWDDASEAVIADLLVADATSIQKYGYRPLAFESLLTYQGHDDEGETTSTPTEMLKIANYYVSNMSEPRTRITRMEFRPRGVGTANATALWDLLGGIEIGDVVTAVTTHAGGGGFGEDYFVEGIQYDADTAGGATFTNVTLSLDVSPAAYFTENPFGSGDAGVYSALLAGSGMLEVFDAS